MPGVAHERPNFFVWGRWRNRVVTEPFLTSKVAAPVKKVVLGDNFMVALTREGKVMSWGRDEANTGCLGIGQVVAKQDSPKEVLFHRKRDEDEVTDIQMGREHLVALTKSGEVYSWGGNSYGQLGIGSFEPQPKPKKVGGPLQSKPIKQIAVVDNSTFALAATGEVYAWGDNTENALGLDGASTAMQETPRACVCSAKASVRQLEIYENRTVIAHVLEEKGALDVNDDHFESECQVAHTMSDGASQALIELLEQAQEWYAHVQKVKHGQPYEENVRRSEKDEFHTINDDYSVQLARLEKADTHLGALVEVASGQKDVFKRQGADVRRRLWLVLDIFIDACRLRKEKVRHVISARHLSDAVKETKAISAHSTTDFGADAHEEIRKIVAVSKELQGVLGRISIISAPDGPTRDLKATLREAIECKLQLNDTRVELLKAAEGGRFDIMLPALRIIKDRWTQLKHFSLYELYVESESKALQWESDDQHLEHLVQESNKQIDQMLQIDKDHILSRETLVPELCYELLSENAKLRKMANSYQLHVLLLYKGKNPSGAAVGIDFRRRPSGGALADADAGNSGGGGP